MDVFGGTADIRALNLETVDLADAGSLTEAEIQRAGSMPAAATRRRFLAGRLAVRKLVAEQFDVAPREIMAHFRCRRCGREGNVDHGRPGYTLHGARVPLGVSFSRCGAWLVCLLSREVHDIGIDMEDCSRSAFADGGIETVFVSTAEQLRLLECRPHRRAGFRARIWARKEAALKATGDGLEVDPSTVDVGTWVRPQMLSWPVGAESLEGMRLQDVNASELGLPPTYMVSTAFPGRAGSRIN